MEIPEKLKLEYLLALDTHIETVGKENKEDTMKKCKLSKTRFRCRKTK